MMLIDNENHIRPRHPRRPDHRRRADNDDHDPGHAKVKAKVDEVFVRLR